MKPAGFLGASLCLVGGAVALLAGCEQQEPKRVIDLWHQMRPEDAKILDERVAAFVAKHHDEITVRVLFKETEELRSGLVAAVLAGRGPEIIYGASDVLGVYQAMGALADMDERITDAEEKEFDPHAVIRMPNRKDPSKNELVFLGDRFGNHLALVYNTDQIETPPKTTTELVDLAKENTKDEDGDGNIDRYGLVWNYTEPFFFIPFLTGYGAWVFDEKQSDAGHAVPALDTPEAIAAYRFVLSLVREHRVLPRSADYESTQTLFLEGKAAMIIDGDWSWQKYLTAPGLHAAVATLPVVDATGLPMAPMVSPKGYSLSTFAKGQDADDAMLLIDFLTDEETQRVYLDKQGILPSRLKLRDDPKVAGDPVMVTSLEQAERGRTMPTAFELRAVWDGMKPPYQLLLAGAIDPEEAARRMQQSALEKIDAMSNTAAPNRTAALVYAGGLVAAVVALIWQRRSIADFFRTFPKNRLAYALALPSVVLIFLTVLYPLVYNVVLSFSNMSLTNLRDWEVVGSQNYESLLAGRKADQFWGVFGKTIVWTVTNVFFHVTIGVLLAVALNGPLRGKSIYRVLLVIPWAVPAYITALTWRGMFDEQFGAVNQLLRALSGVNAYLPYWLEIGPINWLGQAHPAFAACIIANVWLGFPFMMIIALGALQGIPAELYEAARIDRASRWQQFRTITLPMLRPVLLPAITLGAVWTFNNLNVVWLVSKTGEPADQTHILVSYVYKAVFNMYQYGYGAALSMVIFLMLLAFSFAFLRGSRATEAAY